LSEKAILIFAFYRRITRYVAFGNTFIHIFARKSEHRTSKN